MAKITDAALITALTKLVKEADCKNARALLKPGKYEVDATFRVKGVLDVGEDGDRAPTASIPLLSTLAYFISEMGVTAEAAIPKLVKAMKKAMKEGDKAGDGIDAAFHEKIDKAMKLVQEEIVSELPRTSVKGSVKAALIVDELVAAKPKPLGELIDSNGKDIKSA